MRRPFLAASIAVLALAACDNSRKPTAANFTAAINRYLATHGRQCIPIGGQFPIDIPVSQQSSPYGLGAKLQTLQRTGLLNEIDTNAVVQSLASSLSLGPHKAEQVRRYTVSTEGQKYLGSVMTDSSSTPAFCYGTKQVGSIIKWTQPATSNSLVMSQVTYTYKLSELAPWAIRPDVQNEFPVILSALQTSSKTDQVMELQLTNTGWDAAQP